MNEHKQNTHNRVFDVEARQKWLFETHNKLQKGAVLVAVPITCVYYVYRLGNDFCWQNWVLLAGLLAASFGWIIGLSLTNKGRLEASVAVFSFVLVGFDAMTMLFLEDNMIVAMIGNVLVIIYSSLFSRRLLYYTVIATLVTFSVAALLEYLNFYSLKPLPPGETLFLLMAYTWILIGIITLILSSNLKMNEKLVTSMDGLITDQQRIINLAGDMSNVLALVVEQIRDASDAFSIQVTDQASAVAEIDSAMDNIQRIAGETAQSSNQTSRDSGRLHKRSSESSHLLNEMEQRFGKVVNANDAVRSEFADLADKAENIGNILAVNREISGGIKILALNAGIEAAKAGRYGLGFRVVATELKAMIQGTEENLNDIRQLLLYIREQARASADRIENNSVMMHQQLEQVTKIGEVFADFSKSLEINAKRVNQITRAANEQQTRLKEVGTGISNIETAASKLGQSASSLQDTIGKITDTQSSLQKLLGS